MAQVTLPTTTTKRASVACDACKLRKVRCNGERERKCNQCEHLDLTCVYSAIKQARRPLQRGRVIAMCRDKQARTSAPVLASASPSSGSQVLPASPDSSVKSMPQSGMPDDFDKGFFRKLLRHFMEASYPFHPILDQHEIEYSIANMHNSREHYAFVHAFGGLTVDVKSSSPNGEDFHKLYTRAIENRAMNIHDLHDISIRRIMTSMWIHNCLNIAKKSDLAIYYLRDAVFMIQTLRLDEPEMATRWSPSERAALQRLYSELFIHERFFCLGFGEYHNPILPPLTQLPDEDPTINPAVEAGFNQIITLFSLVDDVFLRNWHAFRKGNPSPELNSIWVEQINKALDNELHDDDAVDVNSVTSMQHADIVVTRQWLRTLVWQMAMSKYLLSSITTKECMSLLFPVKLVQQLRVAIAGIPGTHIRIHGRGICMKLFEVTDTIANVVIHVPATSQEDEAIRVDHFLFLYRFVCTLGRLDLPLRGILNEKMIKIQEMFPSIKGAEHLLEAATMASSR